MLITSKAIDIYGGYGFCRNIRGAVHAGLQDRLPLRGTNGIQSLDLVGRKLGQNKGMNVMNMIGEIGATVAKQKPFRSCRNMRHIWKRRTTPSST